MKMTALMSKDMSKWGEKAWIAIRKATKNHPCDIGIEGCNDIKKGDLYEHHFHFRFDNYKVCKNCSIHPELFALEKPLSFREITEIWEEPPEAAETRQSPQTSRFSQPEGGSS